MSTHPIDKVLSRMSEQDRRIAERLSEAGFSDEALYAALPSPGAIALLQNKAPAKPKAPKKAQP